MGLILIGALFFNVFAAHAETAFVSKGSLQIHYGVFKPQESPPLGDILYIHGYGDTFENHLPLFNEWNRLGLRVIAFDLPSHGKTHGGGWDDLDWHSFEDLAHIGGLVNQINQEDPQRPLFLSGWSTGGLLALRILQVENLRTLFPPIRGLVAYAPGVSVKKCVGNVACHITNETLTHDERLQDRAIHPKSPLYRINFAAKLLYNAHMSWNQSLPPEIPVLIFVADDVADKYVKSRELKKWVYHQRQQFSSVVSAFQCPGARHELDNETASFGGPQVRALSASFIKSVMQQQPMETVKGPCFSF